MLKNKGAVGFIGAAAAVVGMLTAAAPAGASDISSQASKAEGKHCVVVVGKAAKGGVSPELYRGCADTAAEARAQLKTPKVQERIGTKASTALMTWYAHAGYGTPATTVYGSYGTCDASGYRLHPDSYWSYNISSAVGHGNCTVATFHNRARNYAATWRLPVSNLGSVLNDNVGIIDVWHG
ncbi:hypothetical protein [Streptomyces sp. NPDC006610]|uniref:hypothetical protein n=1 Tax=Streptomyces sp. NPDC006610 TaxID=3154584 RepID=UPI0033B88517